MGKGELYDAVTDVKGLFSEEFKKYVKDEKLPCHLCNNNYSFACLFNQDKQSNAYLDLVYNLMMVVESSLFTGSECLAQFWRAKELMIFGERHFLLTTRNQPFLIMGSDFKNRLSSEGICAYRMKMVDLTTGVAGGGKMIGRVFRRNRIEYTPNIGYYSSEEYPHRELAISCGIKCSFAIPVSNSSGHLVGVIEVVSPSEMGIYFQKQVVLDIKSGSSLRYLDHCKDLCGQAKSLHIAVSEIKDVMKVIGRSCGLVRAQTWILCNHCGSLSLSKSLDDKLDASYSSEFLNPFFFPVADYLCCLKKGEGVVGKAATSYHNLVYCEDVSRFSITEYPMAHVDRHFSLTASFAICLRSHLTGSQIYVLEFFPNPSRFDGRDLKVTLVPVLDDLKRNFRTFKVASGEEIGDNLFVQVIDAHSPDKIVSLRNVENSTDGTDDPITGASMKETPFGSDSTVESKCWVNIRVNHGDDLFVFQLSSSLGILDLSAQVSQSMNLKDGTYNIKYLDDDNDPILIACDDDLRQYILSSIKQEKYTLMMTIEPK